MVGARLRGNINGGRKKSIQVCAAITESFI